MEILKRLLNVFSGGKKKEPVKTFEDLEALKREFLETDFYLSSNVLSSAERNEANAKLHSLAIEIASFFGGPEMVEVLADTLRDIPKEKTREPSEALKELLRSGDLLTLIKEFKANLFIMLVALNGDVQENLNIRLGYVATEIASRMGGSEFFWKLSTVLQE